MKKIEEIYVCVFDDYSVDSEGLMNTYIVTGSQINNIVLVTAEQKHLEPFKDICKNSSKQEGKKIKILKFTCREVLEEIDERH